jgi:hypothetical protein
MTANIVVQQTYFKSEQSNPWRLRLSRLGITAKAVDADGNQFTLFIGDDAHAYLLRKQGSPLDYTSDTDTSGFSDRDSEGESED